MAGTKVRLWKQDPSVTAIGVRSAYIHTPVQTGPRDPEIEIHEMPNVHPNSSGDFLFSPVENPLAFDAVHTFTVGYFRAAKCGHLFLEHDSGHTC